MTLSNASESESERLQDNKLIHNDKLIPLVADDAVKLVTHEQIDELDVVVLTGFLGNARADRWRIYSTLQMNEYVEFKHADVVARLPLPSGAATPVEGSIVWLKGDALVTYGRSMPAQELQQQATFLKGNVAAVFLPQGGNGGWVPPGSQRDPHSGAGCSTLPGCFT